MSDKSAIQWTDATWNPVTGCTKVSPGCDHCYAETFAERFRGVKGHHFENGFDVTLRPERLKEPRRWRKPRRVFVNSMSDLFHKDVPDDFIRCVFDEMANAGQHTFQVLTKRPERMRRFVRNYLMLAGGGFEEGASMDEPSPNVWLGVSVESGEQAWRIEMLRETPAAIRFLSLEPLLAPPQKANGHTWALRDIDWVIVGGESGSGHRPMDLDWARKIRDHCKAMGIAFFFKQVGAFRPTDDMIPDDLRIREFPV